MVIKKGLQLIAMFDHPFDNYYKEAHILPGKQLRHYAAVRLLHGFPNIESSPALRQDKSYALSPALKRITDNV